MALPCRKMALPHSKARMGVSARQMKCQVSLGQRFSELLETARAPCHSCHLRKHQALWPVRSLVSIPPGVLRPERTGLPCAGATAGRCCSQNWTEHQAAGGGDQGLGIDNMAWFKISPE